MWRIILASAFRFNHLSTVFLRSLSFSQRFDSAEFDVCRSHRLQRRATSIFAHSTRVKRTFFIRLRAIWPPMFPKPINPILAAVAAAELDMFLINTALIVDLQVAEQIERCNSGIDTHFKAIFLIECAWKNRNHDSQQQNKNLNLNTLLILLFLFKTTHTRQPYYCVTRANADNTLNSKTSKSRFILLRQLCRCDERSIHSTNCVCARCADAQYTRMYFIIEADFGTRASGRMNERRNEFS